MAAVPDKVLRWLWDTVTSRYQDPDRTYSDAAKALQLYPSLRPRTDIYTSPSGTSALLLHINGTVPVAFRGAAFNIPIAIWVPLAYPREPPIIYVTPTTGMVVRPGQHVSIEGMVYHPHLANWSTHWDRSSIADFIAILLDVFAKEPPVVAAGQSAPFQARQYQAGPSSRPSHVPPTPQDWRQSTAAPHTTPAWHHQEPQAPPKPPKPGNPEAERPSRDSAPPPPPKPFAGASREHQAYGHGSPVPQRYETSSPGGHQQYRPGGPPLPPLPGSPARMHQDHVRASSYSYQQPVPVGHHTTYSPTHPTQYQQQRHDPRLSQYALPPQGHPGSPNPQFNHHQRQPPLPTQPSQPVAKRPAQDLLTSPLEPALSSRPSTSTPSPMPQRPPNPEKDALLHALSAALRIHLSTTLSQNAAALPPLQAQHAALLRAESAMRTELSQLHALDATLTANEAILHDSMREADRVRESVGQREPPAVDEVLVAPTVVGEQLYGLVADERGIADALFLLSKALDRGRVEGDVFVRQTRSLAREQFMRRALIRKVARGMGLDGV